MIGTLVWRTKEALAVLLGQKKTISLKTLTVNSPEFQEPESALGTDKNLKDLVDSVSIEFFFCEFGENRRNAGGSSFAGTRLDPSLSSLKKYFPDAKFTVYSDFDLDIPGVTLKKITDHPVPDRHHPRYGYRVADYYKFKCLTESTADFACVIDSDMFIYSKEVYRLIYLTKTFKFCAPYNARFLMKNDMNQSLDVNKIDDQSGGFGHAYNQSPMTLWKNDQRGMEFYHKCCEIMSSEPSRASLVMWKAANVTGLFPYVLPQQWCVCAEDLGIGQEVILHVGHPVVAKYYNIKL